MAELGGLTPEQQSRIGAMLSWYENVGRYLGGAGQRAQPVRMDSQVTLCKASSTISASCSGSVEMWRSTAVSTEAETAQGTTFTAYDWFGSGASTGDKLFAFRETRSGRYYFLKPGGGTYGWYGRGGYRIESGTTGTTSVTLSATGEYMKFYTTSLPATPYAPAGVSMTTDLREIEFTADGTYDINWGIHAQAARVAGTSLSSEIVTTIWGIAQRSTGSTVWSNLSHSQIRFSIGQVEASGDVDPENQASESLLLLVKSGHKVRFKATLSGMSSKLQVTADGFARILKLANAEVYATTETP